MHESFGSLPTFLRVAVGLLAVGVVACGSGDTGAQSPDACVPDCVEGGGDSGYTADGSKSLDGSTDSQIPADGAVADSGVPSDPTGVVAVSAHTFLGSLGVNTHIDQGYSATQYVTPLQFTGIRNIRDGEHNLSSTILLHQQTG